MEELLKGYPVVIELPVVWGDMDAFGHVNNVVFYRYYECSRVEYIDRIGLWDAMERNGTGPILASSSCRYKFPLTYPDTVSVGSRTTRIEEDRFFMEHVIVSHKHRGIAAEGEGVIVTYNYRESSKQPIPEDVLLNIQRLENI